MRSGEKMSKEITVSISILTSGKKKELEKCLQSLQMFRREVSTELIIVDTGCDAEHRKIIERYADQIVDFKWCDDFAKARNAGLEKACGKWFLYVDDDEWFEDMSQIIDFFRTGEYREYQYAMYIQRNYEDFSGSRYHDAPVGRMIQLDENTHFIYPIHECFADVGSTVKYLGDYVHHYGYVYTDEESKLAHAKRNIEPLKKLYMQEPENLRHVLQLMQEYSVLREYEKVISMGVAAIERYHSDDNEQIYYFNSLLVLTLLAMNKLKRTKEFVKLGNRLADHPYIGKLAEAYVHALLSYGYRETEEYQKSVESVGTYLELLEEYRSDATLFRPFETGILSPCFREEVYHSTLENGIMSAISAGEFRQADEWCALLELEEEKPEVGKKLIVTVLRTLTCPDTEEKYALSLCSRLLEWEQTAECAEKILPQMLHELPEEQRRIALDRWKKILMQRRMQKDKMELVERDEFFRLAGQVKHQAKELLIQERKNEARQILQQLQKMLPEDEEVHELLQKAEG